jgi:hypothetical protein
MFQLTIPVYAWVRIFTIIFDDLHAEFTTLKGVFGQKRSLLKTKI